MAYDLLPLVKSWRRSLKARKLSEATIRVYERSGNGFADYLRHYAPPADDPDARPTTAATRFRSVTGARRPVVEELEG
ncbi:hypothetical protein LHJ74_11470 [Streptomyces sp. N2-109]|uniref:Integrase n=1 Tax=Streptomyces gossypii TaxID=2883101 RepID=A0ABT2JRK1_9ACTN|nr:hypothetical protein [Streptomyces gossypii]MCT2590520.1 hypothetical protein [Streptomyces gossypii]